jgi:hypothetical protein
MSALTVLREEISERVARAVSAEPAKVIALRLGVTERHVRGLQRREHGASAAALLLLAQDDAELRFWIAQLLNLDLNSDRALRLMAAIERRLGEEVTP